MMKKILLAVLAVAAVFVVIVMAQPSEFKVERSVSMTADPSTVFPQVNNLRNWEAWSPWIKIDPNAKTSYSGPDEGVGASFAWSGNNELGQGSMTVTDSVPSEVVRFRLDFIRPFAGTNTAEFKFKPEGDKTVVSWSMEGNANFISKAIGLFIDCEKMVGDQFDKGLLAMKEIVEK